MKHFVNLMDANFTYYIIDLGDIWEYEHTKFLAGETEPILAKKIIDLLQGLIIKYGESSFGKEMSEIDREYYNRNVWDYRDADLKMQFVLEYFIHKDDCYEYGQNIVLLRDYQEFPFFFSLKLSQYIGKLEQVDCFLAYHLLNTFNNDSSNFRKFIRRLTFQFPTLFEPGLKLEIEEFIASRESQKIEETINSKSNASEPRGLDIEDPKRNSSQIHKISIERNGPFEDPEEMVSSPSGNSFENIKLWIGANAQLDILYHFVNGILIKKIDQEEFTRHFTGEAFKNQIDWNAPLNVFIELFDGLASLRILNPSILKPNNQLTDKDRYVVIISKLTSHFKFKGVNKTSNVLNNVRSQFYQSKTLESKFHKEISEFFEKLKD